MTKKTLINKRLHLYYSGSVQGVGFRYTAHSTANSLGLTGWAKNMPDGRVEVLCEGRDADLQKFMQKIGEVFKGYIRDVDVGWGGATGEFDGFDIRF
ncbi:MAG: acylphosphatase [Candidatus Omnitrophica bacterium]|nr:acylphosphatase [Candidatus Omnitrophota bacterium]MDD5436040.1 acylphosphatase [Candidatus Omnitrophota bacterium]